MKPQQNKDEVVALGFRAAALGAVGGPVGWVHEIESVAGAS